MPTFNPRAALVAAMLSLPGAGASALTCAEDPARAETLAREATAIIIGRVALMPDPGAAPQAEAAAPPGAPPAPTVFATAPIVHELTAPASRPRPRASAASFTWCMTMTGGGCSAAIDAVQRRKRGPRA